MLVFEVDKEDVDYVLGFFEDCKEEVGIVETHRFNGSSEIIQIAVVLTLATIGRIVALIHDMMKCEKDIKIKGDGQELRLEDVTEEYLREYKQK